jgi:hypothetical protein
VAPGSTLTVVVTGASTYGGSVPVSVTCSPYEV